MKKPLQPVHTSHKSYFLDDPRAATIRKPVKQSISKAYVCPTCWAEIYTTYYDSDLGAWVCSKCAGIK